MVFAMASLLFTSCTKENQIIDETDPVEEIDPTHLEDNPLIDNAEARSDSEGINLGCFSIEYPFSLDIDGEEVEINSEEDFENISTSINEESIVDFVYPLNITFENEENQTIENAEQLAEAFAECIPDQGWDVFPDSLDQNSFPAYLINTDESCFDLVYPVSLLDLVTGDEVIVNDEDEFIAALADAESFLFFNFPLTLIGEEGEVLANNGEELWTILISCEYDGSGAGIDTTFNLGGEILCYDVSYPFTVLLANGNEVVVNNHEEYCALMLEGQVVDFVYPITLINAEGEEVIVNSQEEFAQALEDCGFIFGGDNLFFISAGDNYINGEYGCYDINYPITAIANGETIELTNGDELIELTSTSPDSQIVFPVSITLNDTEEVVELNSMQDLFSILEDCQ